MQKGLSADQGSNISNFSRSHSSRGIFSTQGGKTANTKSAIAALVLGLTACGGGDPDTPEPTDTYGTMSDAEIRRLDQIQDALGSAAPIPLEQIPTEATAAVELGPISGGTVRFQTLSGKELSMATTGTTGVLIYNPQDIVAKMGTDKWAVIMVSGGKDTDIEDDGIRDAVATTIKGSFRMLVSRDILQDGRKIIVNPRAGAVSEALLSRDNPTITDDALNQIAQETGAEDTTQNGVVNYYDLLAERMKDVQGVSGITPHISGYIRSIHSGDLVAKNRALRLIARTENHIIPSIIASPKAGDHLPALRLRALSSDSSILYTLDGSIPLPGSVNTKRGLSNLVVPFQSATITYREEYNLGGEKVLGKVSQFDLTSDWTSLAQKNIPYNVAGKPTTVSENFTYKNTPYSITSVSNSINPGSTYPKTIDCQVSAVSTTGCQLGPYYVASPLHEARVRSQIDAAVKLFIDNPLNIDPYVDVYRYKVVYNGSTYTMTNTWTKGPNNTRIFPVRIDVTIVWKDGKPNYTSNRIVNTQADLTSYNTQLEAAIKEYIDSRAGPEIRKKNTYEIIQDWITYGSSNYMIQVIWNTTGSTTTNYPTTVMGLYKSPKTGANVEVSYVVNSDADRLSKVSALPAILKERIDSETIITPTPTCSLNETKRENYKSYRGAYYQSVTLCNMNGTADYPMQITAEYTLPGSSTVYTTPGPTTVYNYVQKVEQTTYHLSVAQARIDAALDDIYPPGHIVNTPRQYYAGGSYFFTIDYSKVIGKDFPAMVSANIAYQNGYTEGPNPINSSVMDAGQAEAAMNSYASFAKQQIDNYNPSYPANTITSDGPYSYGNRGSAYSYKVKYNRVGTGANYPALVWIEYKSGNGGTLLDTRTTYGNTVANSSLEKDQIKATLTAWVKGQVLAQGDDSGPGSNNTMFATNWKIRDLLPFGVAHAETIGANIYVKPYNLTYRPFELSPTTSITSGFFTGYNAQRVDHNAKKVEANVVVAKKTIVEIQEEINRSITNMMQKYSTDGTIYFGDLPDAAVPVMTAIFTDIINKKTADAIYTKYKLQLTALGVTVETMARMHGNILIVASEGMSGSQDMTMEVVDYGMMATGVGAGFQLGKFAIYQIIKKSTGAVLTRSIVGAGGVTLLQYESKVIAGRVAFRDADGVIIKMTKGNNSFGLDHLITRITNSNGNTRFIDLVLESKGSELVKTVLGKESIQSLDDWEKIIGHIISKGTKVDVGNNTTNYILKSEGIKDLIVGTNTNGKYIVTQLFGK